MIPPYRLDCLTSASRAIVKSMIQDGMRDVRSDAWLPVPPDIRKPPPLLTVRIQNGRHRLAHHFPPYKGGQRGIGTQGLQVLAAIPAGHP